MSSTAYEKWRSNIDRGSVDLKSLNADIQRLDSKITAEETSIRERRAALDEAKADLEALRSLRNFLVHAHDPANGAPAPHVASPGRGRPRGSKRDAILSMLADGQSLHTSAIRKLLVDAGEMGEDQPSYHALQVTLSQMYRAGELEREGRGVYRRRPSNDEILEHMAYES